VVEENTVNNETSPEQPVAEAPYLKMPAPESRFLFVDVAALRAKQLRRGARVRIPGGPDGEPAPDLPRKPERIAMMEVRQGLVSYELFDPVAEAAEKAEKEKQ
jgi:DNA-directed RNA polymerase subunit K/omega